MILALLPLPFGIIIELSNFSFCISVIFEFLAFGHLRIRKGGKHAVDIAVNLFELQSLMHFLRCAPQIAQSYEKLAM